MNDELEFHPVADIFPMMSEREFADLCADVAEHGLREPVWLHADGRIIDGRNRYLACRRAGLPCEFRAYDGDDGGLVAFVVSLNRHRRHLTDSQKAMAASKAETIDWGGDRKSLEYQDANWRLDRSEAAELFGSSERSMARAKAIRDRGVPELGERVDSGNLAVSTAATIADAPEDEQRRVVALDDEKAIIAAAKDIKRRKIEAARQREPEPVEPVSVPEGRYSCFVIDPPWPVQKIEREERPNQGAALDYATMPVFCTKPGEADDGGPFPCFEFAGEDGYQPCQSIQCVVGQALDAAAHNDCHIYLWVTQKYLPDGLRLLNEWGFGYQCVMTWRKNVGITPYSWMYDTEHVLFARKGNLKLQRLGLRLSFDAAVVGHSVKPDVFYDRVREASPGPRLDMFPGVAHDGFEPWGLEASHRGVV